MKQKFRIIFFASILALTSTTLYAADDYFTKKKMKIDDNSDVKKISDDDKAIFSMTLENDLFTGTDLGYSNGIRFSYISAQDTSPQFLKKAASFLPLLQKDGKRRISVAGGQSMYTPSNITSSEFQKDDFLYAGWLYGSLGITTDSGKIYDNSMLTLGVVGPSAHGGGTQKFIHHITKGSAQPKGWKYQLHDEPGINFSYERKWREIFEAKPFGIGIDVIPHLGASLGNVSTYAATGATFRIGYDLPSDYGPPRIRPNLPGSDFFIPAKKLGGYLFSILEMRAVGRNIFLDGNTFENSAHVDKRIMVKSAQIGVAMTYQDLRIAYSQVFVSKEFKGQKNGGTEFGSVAISYRF